MNAKTQTLKDRLRVCAFRISDNHAQELPWKVEARHAQPDLELDEIRLLKCSDDYSRYADFESMDQPPNEQRKSRWQKFFLGRKKDSSHRAHNSLAQAVESGLNSLCRGVPKEALQHLQHESNINAVRFLRGVASYMLSEYQDATEQFEALGLNNPRNNHNCPSQWFKEQGFIVLINLPNQRDGCQIQFTPSITAARYMAATCQGFLQNNQRETLLWENLVQSLHGSLDRAAYIVLQYVRCQLKNPADSQADEARLLKVIKYTEALSDNSLSSARLLLIRGQALRQLNEPLMALDTLTLVLKKRTQRPAALLASAHQDRAKVYMHLKRRSRAREDLQKALAINPHATQAAQMLQDLNISRPALRSTQSA